MEHSGLFFGAAYYIDGVTPEQIREDLAAMQAAGLGLEEYWALLRKERALTLTRGGEPWAYLYCAPCEGNWSLPLQPGAAWDASADNTGWAVLIQML